MSQVSKKLVLAVGLLLLIGSTVWASDMDYSWEKWFFPGELECSILYDGNGDDLLEEYHPIASEGYITFRAGFPFDQLMTDESDWTIVFEADNGSRIKLEDARWNGNYTNGRKENVHIYPEHQTVKYFYEGQGAWCGYDSDRDLYFWGKWTTSPSELSYCADYLMNGGVPSLKAKWTVEGCSDAERSFKTTEGTFHGTRIERGY